MPYLIELETNNGTFGAFVVRDSIEAYRKMEDKLYNNTFVRIGLFTISYDTTGKERLDVTEEKTFFKEKRDWTYAPILAMFNRVERSANMEYWPDYLREYYLPS